jgi:septum formation protein
MFILASNSPRRQELLGLIGVDFKIHAPEIDEVRFEGENAIDFTMRISLEKAKHVAGFYDSFDFLLSADTIVLIDDMILGKPKDDEDAFEMLEKLSGKSHKVITAFTIMTQRSQINDCVATEVVFKTLTDEEIKRYIETGESSDKAGAYAVQGFAAYMVQEVKGSYTNVVGLPLSEVYVSLEKMGYKF